MSVSFLSSTALGDSPGVRLRVRGALARICRAGIGSRFDRGARRISSGHGPAGDGLRAWAVVTPVFAIVHRALFESRRKSPWFVPSPTQNRLLALALALGLLAGLANAWFLATELAKR